MKVRRLIIRTFFLLVFCGVPLTTLGAQASTCGCEPPSGGGWQQVGGGCSTSTTMVCEGGCLFIKDAPPPYQFKVGNCNSSCGCDPPAGYSVYDDLCDYVSQMVCNGQCFWTRGTEAAVTECRF